MDFSILRNKTCLLKKLATILAIINVTLLIGCSGGSDSDDVIDQAFNQSATISPIESVAKTAVPLSYAANIAMHATHGVTYPDVAVSQQCASYPCLATLIITLQPDDLPIPIDGIEDNGEVFIAGLWSSPNEAVLTLVFEDVELGNEFLASRKISTVPVSSLSGITTVAYSNFDLDIDTEPDASIDLNDQEIADEYDRLNASIAMDPEINLDLDAWVVELNTNGTAGLLTDDDFTIVGGGQYFEAGAQDVSVLQIGAVGIELDRSCALNPVNGNAILQEVRVSNSERDEWPVIGQAILEFHSDCDGNAEVIIGTGSFLFSTGDEVDLEFEN